MTPQVVVMLPCTEIDEIAELFTALGFAETYRQIRPNPYIVVAGHGFELHYYGMAGHRPEDSHSTCGVLVDDPAVLFEAFAAGLRARYGRLPMKGFPRITRPRPRKNVDGVTGFSLIDPAGNWIRVFRNRAEPQAAGESSPLRESLMNAVVLADSKGEVAQAAKILGGAVRRADPADPAQEEAREFLAELVERGAPGTDDLGERMER